MGGQFKLNHKLMFSSNSLPVPEILNLVFDLATDEGANAILLRSVTQVCQIWRYAALDHPNLWSKVKLRCLHASQKHEVVVQWLQRSRKYPVTIDILAVRPLNKPELAILTEHANHIRHLHFSSYNLPTMFLSSIKTPFPKLEKLDWDIVRTDERFSVVKGPNRIMQPMSLPLTSQKM
ncbi:hypothetical protein C8J56DRAFT_364341 [Mycena floridula]|nr:hypothetical protein C8J56DRAFT_364341 [Mycena floridula]